VNIKFFINLTCHRQHKFIYCSYRNAGDPYEGDHFVPVYQWGSENTSSSDVLKILLKPVEEALLCKKPPKSVSHNVCFLLDTTLLQLSNDWKCDDMGSWKHNGNGYTRFSIRNGEISLIKQDKAVASDETMYTLKRTYYKNKSSNDLNKYASYLVGMVYFVVIYFCCLHHLKILYFF
jgi:hypothetical protein